MESKASTKAISDTEWQKLTSLGREISFQDWLELQCRIVDSTTMGLLALRNESANEFESVAIWPADANGAEDLVELIDQVIDVGSGLVTPLRTNEATSRQQYGVAFPIVVDDAVMAVAALSLGPNSNAALREALHQLQWGCSWIELGLLRARTAAQEGTLERTSHALSLLSKVLGEAHFEAASMRLVAEMAQLTGSDLVALGFRKKSRMRLEYLSDSARFSKEMNLIRATESAMDEAVDQRGRILFPNAQLDGEGLADHAHRQLSKLQKDAALLTVLLFDDQVCDGALSLQRDETQPFTREEADFCESVVALAASALQEKRKSDEPLARRVVQDVSEGIKRLLGYGHWELKLALLVVLALGAFFFVVEGSYRLSGDAVLEARTQRVVVAPYDGFINEAPISAGDRLESGQLLVALDERDLQLERLKWESQENRLRRQYQEAIADHDRSRVNVIEAQLEQASAQKALAEAELARAAQFAPFAGLVVSGDLQQRLGGPVAKGEVLFEISPDDTYRVMLRVAENRISDVRVGQSGDLYLSALPEQVFTINVEKVRPITEVGDGGSYFLVEAGLEGVGAALRPGMEGVGKIYVDERRLITMWTRSALEWLRLKVWSLWG